MEIRILSAGKEIGPYPEAQVRQYLSEGLISPSDLAICEGVPDWQPVGQLLAELPMQTSASAAGDTQSVSIRPTATQRTKRGPIVLQPIFAGNGGGDPTRRPRTGKTALTIEAPRPTTQLPPVAKFVPNEERKAPKSPVSTGPLAPGNFFERPKTEPAALAPTTPPEPVNDLFTVDEPPLTPVPDIPPVETEPPEPEELPNLIVYAGIVIGLLALTVFVAFAYLFWHFNTPAPRGSGSSSQSHPANVVETGSAPALRTSADYSASGFTRQSQGDLKGALADYDQAVKLDPQNAEAIYRRALARQTKGDGAGALADYNILLTLQPNNADAFSNRGYVKQAQGDLDGALADYAEALIRNPKIAVAYYNIGLIKVQRRDIDGGIDAYSRAIDLDPKLTRAYYNRGNAKSVEGYLDGAIADYTQALELDPTIAMAYFARGFARQSKGDSSGALSDYSLALLHDSSLGAAYYNRGQLEVQSGDFDAAVADSTKAIEFDPKNGPAFCNRGLAEVGQGKLDNAEADLDKYCQLAPQDPGRDSARLYLWLIRAQQNLREQADETLTIALEKDWNSSPEDLTSKIAAFLLGHIRESELIAAAASPDLSREPGQYCKVWYFAGMKRLIAGDTATALTYLQKSTATGQKDFCEYLFARAELTSLGQSRQASSQPGPASP